MRQDRSERTSMGSVGSSSREVVEHTRMSSSQEVVEHALRSGACVQFTTFVEGATSLARFVPSRRSGQTLSFRLEGAESVGQQKHGRENLRVGPHGNLDFNGGNGPWTEFAAEWSDTDGTATLKAVKTGKYLKVGDSGEVATSERPTPLLIMLSPTASSSAAHPPVPATGPRHHDGVLRDWAAKGVWLRLNRPQDDRGGAAEQLPLRFRLRTLQEDDVFVLQTDAGGNIACGPQGQFHDHGGQGQWARWRILKGAGGSNRCGRGQLESPTSSLETAADVTLLNMGHGKYAVPASRVRGERHEKGVLHCTLQDTPFVFAMSPFTGDGATAGATTPTADIVEVMPPVCESVLSSAEIAHFKEQGYLVLKSAVSLDLVHDALRSINYQLGKPDCWQADPNPLNNFAPQLNLKLPPGHGVGRDIVNKSPRFWSAINILLGEGNVAPWRQGQQIALRFPQPWPEQQESRHPPAPSQEKRARHLPQGEDISAATTTRDVAPGTRYHIDGMGQNRLCPFSLLCGVALSDQMRPDKGNLHVFPGSHLNKELRKYYLDKIDDDAQGEADPDKPDLGSSTQVLLSPGDVVIAHQLLAHRIGRNFSHEIRYQLYYRVKHVNHETHKQNICRDPWTEFAI